MATSLITDRRDNVVTLAATDQSRVPYALGDFRNALLTTTVFYVKEQTPQDTSRYTEGDPEPYKYETVGLTPADNCAGFRQVFTGVRTNGQPFSATIKKQGLQDDGTTQSYNLVVNGPYENRASGVSVENGGFQFSGWGLEQVGLNLGQFKEFLRASEDWLGTADTFLGAVDAATSATETAAIAYLDAGSALVKSVVDYIEKFLNTLDLGFSWTTFDVPYNFLYNAGGADPKVPVALASADKASVDALINSLPLWAAGAAKNDTLKRILQTRGGGAPGLLRQLTASLSKGFGNSPYLPEGSTVAGISFVAGTTASAEALASIAKTIAAVARLIANVNKAFTQLSTNASAWLPGGEGSPPVRYVENLRYVYVNGAFQIRWQGYDNGWYIVKKDNYEYSYFRRPAHVAIFVSSDARALSENPLDTPTTHWQCFSAHIRESGARFIRFEDEPSDMTPAERTALNPSMKRRGVKEDIAGPLDTNTYVISRQWLRDRKILNLKNNRDELDEGKPVYVRIYVRSDPRTLAIKGPKDAAARSLTDVSDLNKYALRGDLTLYARPGAGTTIQATKPYWRGANLIDGPLGAGFKDAAKQTLAGLAWLTTGTSDLIKDLARLIKTAIADTRKTMELLKELATMLKELSDLSLTFYTRAFYYVGIDPTNPNGWGILTDSGTGAPPPLTGKAALLHEYQSSLAQLPFQSDADPCVGLFFVLNTAGLPPLAAAAQLKLLASLLGVRMDSAETPADRVARTYADVELAFREFLPKDSAQSDAAAAADTTAATYNPDIAVGQQFLVPPDPRGTAERDAPDFDWNCPAVMPEPLLGQPVPTTPTAGSPAVGFTDDMQPIFRR